MLKNILALPFRYKPWQPYHLRLLASDLVGSSLQPVQKNEVHLAALINWLCRAQDRREGNSDAGGIAAGWSFEDGWLPSYPETSGYIVETFIAAAGLLGGSELLDRANRILDWELSIQNEDGSFPGHFGEPGSRPVIFNTGQIMHGMNIGYLHFRREDCLAAAVAAGHWMRDCQDSDGCWRKNVHNGVPHTYNTRAAWALLHTGILAEEKSLINSALRNMEWAVRQQTSSGWYETCAFSAGAYPFTHTIAYAIRGLLEAGYLANREYLLDSALKAATALAQVQREDGWLAGTYSDGWKATASYCCLTGVAQMAINWQRLNQITDQPALKEAAQRGIKYLKMHHICDASLKPHDGAIAGSAPIWGAYSRLEFPNWASKFFADAIMMDMADLVIPAMTKPIAPEVL